MVSTVIKNLVQKFLPKEKIDLLVHTFFNYLDKMVNMLSPLVIIRVLHNELLYNDIEYVLSSSIILSVLVDFGLSSYYFYGYRQSEDKKEYIHTIERSFFLLFALQTVFVFAFVGLYFITKSPFLIVYACILIRTLFLSYTNFKFNTFRVIDKPSKIFFITIPVNLFSLLIFYIAYTYYSKVTIYYFMGLAVFELVYVVYSFLKYSDLRIKQFWPTLKTSVIFAWPLMINVFLINTISNYGKIYAFQNLPAASMTRLALLQRFMIIIQLAHTASTSFFLKKIFDKKSVTIDLKVFKSYSSSMVISVLLIIGCIQVNNSYGLVKYLPFDMSFWFLIVFFIFYAYGAYLSTYFTVLNKNKLRMYSSTVMVVLYMAALWIFKPSTLIQLTLVMLTTMGINLVFTLYYLNKNGVFKHSEI
jgi:O-antigen/teichoic acid export membrane protein